MNSIPSFLSRRLRCAVVAVVLSVSVSSAFANLRTERFWLENTVTREISGPIVRQTGYRFQIGSQGYAVLDSVPGQIRVTTYPQGEPFGPYEIENGRIIDIGLPNAFSIVNLQTAEVPELPPDLQGLLGLEVKGDPKRKTPAPEPVPEIAPVSDWPIRVGAWVEPGRKADYDWKIGGYAGSKASAVKATRLGISAEWGGAFLRLGVTSGGKSDGSLAPETVAMESLRLESGSGFGIAAGYLHPFYLAKGWDALAGASFEWSSESFDLVARTLTATGTEIEEDETSEKEGETPAEEKTEKKRKTRTTYEYRDATSSFDLHELLLAGFAGVQFQEGFWGARALLRIDLVTSLGADGDVSVNGKELSLDADRSHPVGVEAGVWCYWLDQLRTDLSVRAGAVQSVRLGISWEW